MSIHPSSHPRALVSVALALLCVGTSAGCRDARADGPEPVRLGAAAADSAGAPHLVTIHRAYPSLGMNTGLRDRDGMAGRTPCGTCHGFVGPKDKYVEANRLEDFHKGVEILHGGQSCRTCHSVPGFETFNLAGGESLAHTDVMRLCGQCHAQRLVEYERGAHGGMTGYWDLGRGPRSRNHCLDCHNPHAPAVPAMVPAPAPIYRTFD